LGKGQSWLGASLYPSAGARTTASVAIVPPAPDLFGPLVPTVDAALYVTAEGGGPACFDRCHHP
jgi:hypothetical protein